MREDPLDLRPASPAWSRVPGPDLAGRLVGLPGVQRAAVVTRVDSTNARLGRAVDEGLDPDAVLVAWRQTAGRGRRGRTWSDVPDGNAAISLATSWDHDTMGLAPLVVGLAVHEVVEELGCTGSLKWPNDVRVVVDGRPRKVAGILLQAHPEAPVPAVVVGVGINVDWRGARQLEGASGGADAGTSLAHAVGGDVDRDDLVVRLVDRVLGRLRSLQGDPVAGLAAVRSTCATLGSRVRVELVDDVFTGVATGLDERGRLLVRSRGVTRAVDAGDVHHLRPDD